MLGLSEDGLLELDGVGELLTLLVSVLLELLSVLLPVLAPLLRGVALEVELLGGVAELLLLGGVLGELSVALLEGVEFVSVDRLEGERVLLELFIAEPL